MAASPLDAFDIAAEADDLQKRDEAKADRRYEWLVKEFDHIQKNFDKIRENVFKRLETPSNPRFYFYNDPDWLEIEDAITRYPQLELRSLLKRRKEAVKHARDEILNAFRKANVGKTLRSRWKAMFETVTRQEHKLGQFREYYKIKAVLLFVLNELETQWMQSDRALRDYLNTSQLTPELVLAKMELVPQIQSSPSPRPASPTTEAQSSIASTTHPSLDTRTSSDTRPTSMSSGKTQGRSSRRSSIGRLFGSSRLRRERSPAPTNSLSRPYPLRLRHNVIYRDL